MMEGSFESTEIVYAVRLGSLFSTTIWGSDRRVASSGSSGAQMRPLRKTKVYQLT